MQDFDWSQFDEKVWRDYEGNSIAPLENELNQEEIDAMQAAILRRDSTYWKVSRILSRNKKG